MKKLKQLMQKGFTLVELMTVVIIVAILTAFAVPTFSEFLDRRAVDAAVTQVISSVALARSEAIATGSSIMLCGLENSLKYGGSPDVYINCESSSWEDGWQLARFNSETSTYDITHVYQPSRVNLHSDGSIKGVSMRNYTMSEQLSVDVIPKSGNRALGKRVTFMSTGFLEKITDL